MSNRLPILAAEIRQAHEDVRTSAARTAERAIAAGHLLIEAKAAVGHGGWSAWLRTNVEMSERTARRYVQLARSGLETATVADLGIRGAAEALAVSRPTFRDLIADVELNLAYISRAEELSQEWAATLGEASEAVELLPMWEAVVDGLSTALRKLERALDVAEGVNELRLVAMWAEISGSAASLIRDHGRRASAAAAEAVA